MVQRLVASFSKSPPKRKYFRMSWLVEQMDPKSYLPSEEAISVGAPRMPSRFPFVLLGTVQASDCALVS